MMILLPINSDAPKEKFRTNAFIIACVIGVAHIILTAKMLIWEYSQVQIAFLLPISYFVGFYITRLNFFHKRNYLQICYIGFLITSIGFLLLLNSDNINNWIFFLAGNITAGCGQGIVIKVGTKNLLGKNCHWHTQLFALIVIFICSVFLTALVIMLQTNFPMTEGFPYAFALLADLSLLGALYVRIIEKDS